MPRRLIEEAFPLKKVSKDSKHEQECYVKDISRIVCIIWPARRPLAVCRAVTTSNTLLPDPADAPEIMKAEYSSTFWIAVAGQTA